MPGEIAVKVGCLVRVTGGANKFRAGVVLYERPDGRLLVPWSRDRRYVREGDPEPVLVKKNSPVAQAFNSRGLRFDHDRYFHLKDYETPFPDEVEIVNRYCHPVVLAQPPIGSTVLVRAMYLLDQGSYAGEWCMQPLAPDLPFWIPSGDLTEAP